MLQSDTFQKRDTRIYSCPAAVQRITTKVSSSSKRGGGMVAVFFWIITCVVPSADAFAVDHSQKESVNDASPEVSPPSATQSSPALKQGSVQNEGLEEIVVTARKREERLQDVPVALDVYTAKDLQRYSTQSFQDLAEQTPQLVIGSSENTNGGTINLRGIGSSDSSATVDQAISINLDGIQVSQANVVYLGQYDLERIEILKGPQALFFGKNSPGGVISLVSADPGSTFESKVRTGYEVYNEKEYAEAMVSGPLTDTFKARFDVYGSHQIGWFENQAGSGAGYYGPTISNTYPNNKEGFGRLTLTYDPGSTFDFKLKVSADRVDEKNGPASASQSYGCPFAARQTAFGTPDPDKCKIDQYYTVGNISPAVAATNPAFGDGAPNASHTVSLGSLTSNYHPIDEVVITSVTGYFKDHDFQSGNFCQSQISCLVASTNQTTSQYTEELRAATRLSSPLNFVGGVYYQYVEWNDYGPVAFGPPIAPVATLFDSAFFGQQTHSFSAFGQTIYEFSSKWEATAGARWTTETKGQENFRGPSALNGFAPYGPLTLPVERLKFSNVSPEATLSFKPSSDLTAYATYRQGYLSGGFNIVAFLAPGTNNSFSPETVRGGEVGVKGILFDRQLRLTADAYYYKYVDLQLSSFDPTSLSNLVRNAGATPIFGPELALIYAPAPLSGLTLRGGISYNHADYKSFTGPCYGGQSIAAGCDLNFASGAFHSQNLAGEPLVRAPAWAGSVGATFEHPLNRNMEFSTSIDTRYTDAYFTQPEEDPRSLQAAFWKVDAQLALRRADGAWEIALIAKNITNKLIVTGTFSTPFTGGRTGTNSPVLPDLQAEGAGLPRTVMLQFTITDALFRSSHQ